MSCECPKNTFSSLVQVSSRHGTVHSRHNFKNKIGKMSRGVSHTAQKSTSKIPRSIYNFSDSDSEMSYKDRGSPILLESGLKSFLGHPGHNFPLLNGEWDPSHMWNYFNQLLKPKVQILIKIQTYSLLKTCEKLQPGEISNFLLMKIIS